MTATYAAMPENFTRYDRKRGYSFVCKQPETAKKESFGAIWSADVSVEADLGNTVTI